MTTPPAEQIVRALARLPRRHHQALDRLLDGCSNLELAAAFYDHADFWLRPQQITPDTKWRSFGMLTGKGYGKTFALSSWVQGEVRAERAMRIGLCAQNEDKTIDVLITGQSGLVATSPPWFKAVYERKRVIWPNGAQAFPYTPEVPGAIHGPEHDLVWMSEIAQWPKGSMDEAFTNLRLGCRLGLARIIWDSNPRRRHPLIRKLLKRAEQHKQDIVIRGTTRENLALSPEQIAEWVQDYGGTQYGRELLDGEFFDDTDGALWKVEWIDNHRRELPAEFTRRVLSIDPAISTKKGTDKTGIVDLAEGVDGQIYVLANLTGKHPWGAWGELVVDRYFKYECDCVIAERNRGGDAVVENLKTHAEKKNYRVAVVDKKAKVRHDPEVMYVKEETASQSKEGRHENAATLYERGRVSHVRFTSESAREGCTDLTKPEGDSLEDWLCTWEPAPRTKSPDAIDALTQGIAELAGFSDRSPDHRRGFAGITELAKDLAKTPGREVDFADDLVSALGGTDWGDRL